MSVIAEKARSFDSGQLAPLSARLRQLLRHIGSMAERRRQLSHLAQLDDHLLDDIGLTRHQVEAELGRLFWR